MLVLSREIGTSITLRLEDGRTIEIKLLSIKEKRARVGITAPATVNIVRSEIDGKATNA